MGLNSLVKNYQVTIDRTLDQTFERVWELHQSKIIDVIAHSIAIDSTELSLWQSRQIIIDGLKNLNQISHT